MKRFTNAAALTAAAFGMVLASVACGADGIIVQISGDGCQQVCQQDCGKTVCRPIVENKTVVKRGYSDRCTEVCMPCSLLGALLHRECDCGCVKVQKDLVVHLRKHQECVKKCVPVRVPSCAAAPACGTCAPACGTCACGAPECSAPCNAGNVAVTPGQPVLLVLPPCK